ncbi:MAG: patatin-like phospholipase family protein [Pseudomonadota bacterium]
MTLLNGSRAYVALEGGGAKGILHVGALSAIEAEGLKIEGIAGTSAGAIVAALKAAGYRSDEIIDDTRDYTILDELRDVREATDLLERHHWTRLRYARGLGSPLRQIYLLALILACFSLPILVSHHFGWEWGALAFGLVMLVFGTLIFRILKGIASLRGLRNAIGVLLAKKVRPDPSGRNSYIPEAVTFKDFGPGEDRPTLKIIATNLSTGELQLFSPETTPNVPVADAVAASGCIPIAFRAWQIKHGLPEKRKDLFLDGGLLSNLPVWVFDDERVLDRDALSIAVEISDGEPRPRQPPKGFLAWIKRVIRTTIFGGQVLGAKAIGRSVSVFLETDIGVLDLDMEAEAVRETVRQARTSTTVALLREEALSEAPSEIVAVAKELFQDNGLGQFAGVGLRATISPVSDEVISALATNPNAELALQLKHHSGFESYPDEFITVPLARSFIGVALLDSLEKAGEAYLSGEAFFFDLDIEENYDFHLTSEADRWTRKNLNPDLKWALVIPISVTSHQWRERHFVVTLDSDIIAPDEEEAERAFFEVLSWIETYVSDMFHRISGDLES